MTKTEAPWGSRERPWPISVGDLDSWEFFRASAGQPWEMSDESFQNRLARREPVGPPAIIGKAFHSAIENAMIAMRTSQAAHDFSTLEGTTEEGITVSFATTDPRGRRAPVDVTLPAYTVVEQDVELIFETPQGWIQLRGVIDGLRGHDILDLKTTKKFTATKFTDSWQWRAYLAAMGEQYKTFEYHVFTLSYGQPAEKAISAVLLNSRPGTSSRSRQSTS